MTNINVEISGKGEPLVLLHGWGWSHLIWKSLIPQLSSRYTLYAVDLPGFGNSPILDSEYSLEAVSQSLLKHVPEEAQWLGWSLGGLIATWVAIHYPNRVTRLINVCSSPCFLEKESWDGIAPAVLETFCNSLKENQEKTLRDFLNLQLRGSGSSILTAELTKLLLPAHPAALKAGLVILQKTDLRSELFKLICPTSYIFGEIDTIVPASVANSLTTISPGIQCHIIRRAGHMPFLSKPLEFVKYI